MEILLNSPDINPSIQNNLPIRLCIEGNILSLLTILLKDPRIVNLSANNNYIVKLAVKKGNADVIELLLKSDKIEWSANGGALFIELLRTAINKVLPELLAILVADDCVSSLSFNNNELAKRALSKRNEELVKVLLKNDKVDWRAGGNELFIEAVKLGDEDIVELLIKSSKVNPLARGQIALKLAKDNDTIQGLLLEYANKQRIAK